MHHRLPKYPKDFHMLQIICGIDLITSDEPTKRGQVVAWQLKTIGKYDCTIIGVIIALASNLKFYDQLEVLSQYTIAQKLTLSFHNFNKMNDERDILRVFNNRANSKGLDNWITNRIGRIQDRKDWQKIEMDPRILLDHTVFKREVLDE